MNIPASRTLSWLLKREFWENKGGFFWAPVVTGAIHLGMLAMAMVVAEVTLNRSQIMVNNLDLNQLTSTMKPDDLAHVGAALDLSVLMIAALVAVVTFFVLFFYCLGALYDDRRDRSVLFWKSLPISDSATVFSKVLSATLTAPLVAVGVSILTGIGFLLLLSLYVGFHGINPFTLIWAHASPWKVALLMLAMIPVQALWALPSIGWLLLCSAWARSKPFLWAVALPVGTGVMISWFDLMRSLSMPDAWFWKHIVGRLLLSLAPGTWMDFDKIDDHFEGPADLMGLASLGALRDALMQPELWIGAVAGLLMIGAAVYFRRKRDEG